MVLLGKGIPLADPNLKQSKRPTTTATATESTIAESSTTITTSLKDPNNGGIPGIAIRTVYVVSESFG